MLSDKEVRDKISNMLYEEGIEHEDTRALVLNLSAALSASNLDDLPSVPQEDLEASFFREGVVNRVQVAKAYRSRNQGVDLYRTVLMVNRAIQKYEGSKS